MSKVVISMVAMFILMIFPGAGLWGLLSNVLGGGVAESFLYPIYGLESVPIVSLGTNIILCTVRSLWWKLCCDIDLVPHTQKEADVFVQKICRSLHHHESNKVFHCKKPA